MISHSFPFDRAGWGMLVLAYALLLSPVSYSEAAPSPPAGITLDGTMGPVVPLTGPAYQIPDTYGTRAGANLFHSFGQFNLVQGESATFTNSGAPLNNVIARVTGGPSSIDGLIRSTIDGANLFFLNPAGVMFGPNASIDVPGSFHVSTADYLKFSDGSRFYTNTSSTSVLSVADPVAFGFLGPNPAPISGDIAYLQVQEGKTLSIIGGNLTFTGIPASADDLQFAPAVLTAPGGTINLVSVASPGEVRLADMGLENFTTMGKISFSMGAKLDVTNQSYDPESPYYYYPKSGGGSVVIRGGEMIFQDGGIDAYGNPGGSIDIKGDSLHLDNYYFYPNNFNWMSYFMGSQENADQDHLGLACRIDLTGDFLMTHGAFIGNLSLGAGRGGDISIRAKNVLLGDEVLDANSFTNYGYYGSISSTAQGSGESGNIDITADNMTVRNGFFVNTQSYGTGAAGNITVTVANTLAIENEGTVGMQVIGPGNGGIVTISAHDILISAAHRTDVTQFETITGILGQTSFWSNLSNGGRIIVTADRLQLLDGGQISSVLYGPDGYIADGTGTDITINAREMVVSGYVVDPRISPVPYSLSSVDARVFGSGAIGTGGNITITTDSLTLTNGGTIRSGLYSDAPGDAGTITIKAGTIDINSLGQIYADSFRGTGNSGNIGITAGSMTITGTNGAPPPEPDLNFTGLSTSTKYISQLNPDLTGGAITLNLSGDLKMSDGGGIKADTSGDADGGTIGIIARNIQLDNKASINASSTGTGNAGDITVKAGDTLTMRDSSITTEASVDADGGNITIQAPYMIRLMDSRITSSVGGGPETTGGNIFIDPQYIILQDSQIIANAYEGTGGNITLVADMFLQDPLSTVSASSALGVSGTVDIQAPISNVSGIIAPLSGTFISATDLLRERCMARIRGGKYSSFIVGGRDGLPSEPGCLMPSISY